jgi:hypothetical protein
MLWKNYKPITACVPSWYHSKVKQEALLFSARQDNIHFLHLPCNTIPSTKTYILGCQCEGCLSSPEREPVIANINDDPYMFYNTIPTTGEMWNNISESTIHWFYVDGGYSTDILPGWPIFNPFYDECSLKQYIRDEATFEGVMDEDMDGDDGAMDEDMDYSSES